MIIPVRIDKAAAETAAREGTGSDNNGDGGGGQMTATAENNNKGVCVPEWSMVELQGELICKDPLSGQPLGSMTSENVSGVACCPCVVPVCVFGILLNMMQSFCRAYDYVQQLCMQ